MTYRDKENAASIVLITLPFSSDGIRPEMPNFQESLGIGYITSAANSVGAEVEIIDLNLDSLEDLRLRLSMNPDIVGIQIVSGLNEKHARTVLDLAKSCASGAILAAGGPLVQALPRLVFSEFPQLDVLCVGDGEPFIIGLIRYLEQGDKSDVPNAVFRGFNHPTDKEISDFSLRPKRLHLEKQAAANWPVSVCTSRGCTSACTFCAISCTLNRWRCRKAVDVVCEIEELINAGAKRLWFIDENFIGTPVEGVKRAREIAERMRSKNLFIPFQFSMRADFVENSLLEDLMDVGCTKVNVGFESIHDRCLVMYKKGYSSQVVRKAVTTLRNLGIGVSGGYILFDPSSTQKEVLESLIFLKENIDYFSLEKLFNRLQLYEATHLARYFTENGIVEKKSTWKRYYTFCDSTIQRFWNYIEYRDRLLKEFYTTITNYRRKLVSKYRHNTEDIDPYKVYSELQRKISIMLIDDAIERLKDAAGEVTSSSSSVELLKKKLTQIIPEDIQ